MAERRMSERPVVVILFSQGRFPEHVGQEIVWGLEEEGVPCLIEVGEGDADELGLEAARRSSLEVGVGLDDTGRVTVYHRGLRRRNPVYASNVRLRPETARLAGVNAARLVKVLPLKDV